MSEPFIGEIRQGREIGKKPNQGYIWTACPKCGSVRWVVTRHGTFKGSLCCSCSHLVRRQSSPNENVPQIGDIKIGEDIDGHHNNPGQKYIWQACPKCNFTRWVKLINNNPQYDLCNKCACLAQRKPVVINNSIPIIGEIRTGREIGKEASRSYIFQACPKCKETRWATIRNGKPISILCKKCTALARMKVSPNKGVPYIGEIRMGREIGKKHPSQSYIFQACPICGVTWWVTITIGRGEPKNLLCVRCAHLAKKAVDMGTPLIGQIRKGRDVGQQSLNRSFIFQACPKCGSTRWVRLTKGKPETLLCSDCFRLVGNSGRYGKGESHPQWQGGISFEPYTTEFNNDLREQIRKRDNYTCQLCGKPQGKYKLSVHHINYIKEDCRPKNLVSLCGRNKGEINCHALTNHNRSSWMAFFTEMMDKRFPSNENETKSSETIIGGEIK